MNIKYFYQTILENIFNSQICAKGRQIKGVCYPDIPCKNSINCSSCETLSKKGKIELCNHCNDGFVINQFFGTEKPIILCSEKTKELSNCALSLDGICAKCDHSYFMDDESLCNLRDI